MKELVDLQAVAAQVHFLILGAMKKIASPLMHSVLQVKVIANLVQAASGVPVNAEKNFYLFKKCLKYFLKLLNFIKLYSSFVRNNFCNDGA